MKFDWPKYLYAFIITAAIFATAIYLASFFNDKKLAALKAAEDKISIDILSSETQFTLLGELSCEDSAKSVLSQELNSLGEKLDWSEQNFGANNEDFVQLKKYYSLLEIKDYLLVKKLKDCPQHPIAILYFYGKDCPECDKEGYVLTYLRQEYPELRVYSFDYNLDLSALKTLAAIYGVTAEKLPVVVIKRAPYSGFQSIEAIKALLPELSATSTAKTS